MSNLGQLLLYRGESSRIIGPVLWVQDGEVRLSRVRCPWEGLELLFNFGTNFRLAVQIQGPFAPALRAREMLHPMERGSGMPAGRQDAILYDVPHPGEQSPSQSWQGQSWPALDRGISLGQGVLLDERRPVLCRLSIPSPHSHSDFRSASSCSWSQDCGCT
jgi:hypothetical protein